MAKASKAASPKRKSSKTRSASARPAQARRAAPASGEDWQKRILNLVPSPDTQDDWQFETALAASALEARAALPGSVDLRAPWWAINDQGSTGSCVGWSSTDGVARYHFVKANRLPNDQLLSPRFTWMASKETDTFTDRPETFIERTGTTLKAAVDILRRFGAVPDTLLPFHIATNLYAGDPNAFYAIAATRKVASYFNLKKNTTQWRSWLANNGPILAGLNVDATWFNAAQTQGVLDTYQPTTVPASAGHAICVVGYRADGRFIIRNSWGSAWGDKGFAYASEAYISAAFYNESYGVTL